MRHRPNLHIAQHSRAMEILMEGRRAVGVRFLRKDKIYDVYANREVLLSAGAISSPQILMLSGIGPADHLRYTLTLPRHRN